MGSLCWSVVAHVLGLVLLVAVSWEVFELSIGYPIDDQYALDTALDLIMGLTGGYIGYIVGNSLRSL